ncbi:hypothetical protein HOLleu_34125 [Holothuria leucospilota]|uniref:Coiled-coil domain-containing protein 186 n=1 Tax=Holothuria leucospilota TaxID=206669 RepID=A0A9Q1BI46_HOLLE|nr:hypothetical protein HOLleu_34125 [Holothuria leucospilota]
MEGEQDQSNAALSDGTRPPDIVIQEPSSPHLMSGVTELNSSSKPEETLNESSKGQTETCQEASSSINGDDGEQHATPSHGETSFRDVESEVMRSDEVGEEATEETNGSIEERMDESEGKISPHRTANVENDVNVHEEIINKEIQSLPENLSISRQNEEEELVTEASQIQGQETNGDQETASNSHSCNGTFHQKIDEVDPSSNHSNLDTSGLPNVTESAPAKSTHIENNTAAQGSTHSISTSDVGEIRTADSSQKIQLESEESLKEEPSHKMDSLEGANGGKDEDDLESAEDALLSQLDAELDDGSESSDPADIDLANGLTKEAVIEGLVEYQKLKSELEAIKQRHKKKSLDLERLKGENESLRDQLTESERQNSSKDAQLKEKENSIKSQQFKNKELQVVIDQHKEDLDKSREKLRGHDAAAKKAISQLQQEMVVRVNQVKGMYENALKEKENMVMKYAKSEKEVLDLRKSKEALERRLKESQQLADSTNIQMKQLRVEMAKMKNVTTSKESETSNLQKETEQLKEEINSQAIKVKWAQNKLKSELDAHKETKTKLAKTEQRLAEAKEETETIRKNCQDMIRQYQESEEVKSNSLGMKLKKTEEELQIHQQETNDQLELHNAKIKELNSLKQAHSDATAELESLRVRVQCLEEERIQQEEFLTQFKGLLNNQKEANRNLSKELEEAKGFQVHLTEAEENIRQLEEKIVHVQEDGKDLAVSLEASREKESELLQFTEKITSKNAELHAEIGSLQSKVESLTEENKSLQSHLEEVTSKCSQLSTDLQREKEFREREVTILTGRLNEKSKNEENLSLKLEEAKDEAKTLKRRHAANTKDLTRQLQQAKKRLESLEKDGHGNKENNSMGSRTSSSGSLETAGVPSQSASSSARGSISGPIGEEKSSPSSQSPQVTISSGNNDFPGIDKGMLVERIIRLQRLQQKYKEKIEFYQEHNKSLIEVIQKKNKIIQGYVLREETGALSTAASDINKAQMSKQSGIMASLYRSQASDPRMTLDLSLEINQKLQAVLEDTLLKNMTLKENIDTLGREIARLSEELFNTKEQLKVRGK